MLSKFISRINFNARLSLAKTSIGLFTKQTRSFSDVQATKRSHGGLKDQDRIFTNVYKDGDPFIEGAMKRVIKKASKKFIRIKFYDVSLQLKIFNA